MHTDEYDREQPALVAWLTANGVDPSHVQPRVILARHDDNELYIHCTRYVLDTHGRKQLDYAAERPVTTPLVVPCTVPLNTTT